MAKNKLSIYLVKEEIHKDKIFQEDAQVEILNEYSENKILYYLPSYLHEPNWLKNFFDLECPQLKQANSRAVLVCKLDIEGKERIFVITFGYAKNLFEKDVLEEQFGLKIVLNTIGINGIRKITKTSIGTNQKQSQEQMPRATTINEFGFDLDRDLIRAVTGKCVDEMFENAHIIGGDIFSLSVSRNVENIEEFLEYCYKKYQEDKYKENFEWIDNIKEVKSKEEKDRLDEKLIEHITEGKFDCVWMSVPEVIEWERITGFQYGNKDEIYEDITIEEFLDTIRGEVINVRQIKSRRIKVIDIAENEIDVWNAYGCLNAEIQLEDNSYCLNNGKWYYINKDFSAKIEREYETIKLSEKDFINYDEATEDEDEYNKKLTEHLPGSVLIHKIGEIPYGGGRGNKIEMCDIMTADNELIHIKKNGGSSYLSHLFNQATVSAELLLEKDFRAKANAKMKEHKFEIGFPDDFVAYKYKIIIGIINPYHDERPRIPFFSKVSLRYAIREMKKLGYEVELKNIKKIV